MTDRATRLRLGMSLFSQGYGQVVTVLVQLLLVPVLLYSWGVTVYGSWVILTSIPFYLTFSDFGFTFIAKNEMLIAVSSGRRADAVLTYHSIFLLLSIASPFLVAITVVVVCLADVSKLLSLTAFDNRTAGMVLMLFVLNVLLYQYFLLACAGIRSENRPAMEAFWAANSRLGEGAAICIVAIAGRGPITAAVAMVCNRLLFLVAVHVWLRRVSPWLPLGVKYAERRELKRLLSPALAYMCLPLAQAAMIQGPVLAVGAAMGPIPVVTLSTSRTLARLGTSVTNMFNNSLVAEYSALKGRGDISAFKRLFAIHMTVTLVVVASYAAVLMLGLDQIMRVFTHGKVKIIEPFFALVAIGVVAEMFWSALFTPVSAISQHQGITLTFLGLSLVGIACTFPLANMFGLEGTAAVVLVVNFAMVAVCLLLGRSSFSGGMVDRASH